MARPAARVLALVVAAAVALGPLSRSAARANPSRNPQAALEQGRVAYERGHYGEAVEVVYPLLYPTIELGNEEAVVEAHRVLALSYFFMSKHGEAEQEASSLLSLRPNFELDPVVDPPAAVTFFQGIRKRQDDRLREIRERQREDEERARKKDQRKKEEAHAKADKVYVERVVLRHTRAIGFIPFGVGQFYNNQIGYGVGFAVSEVLLGALWASTTFAIAQRYPAGKYPKSDAGTYGTANVLLSVQVGSGIAFWAVVAWGIIDAQIKFRKEIVVETRELPAAPAASQKKSSLSIAPLITITPQLFGLGVQGVF